MTTPNPYLPDSHPAPGYPPENAAPTQWGAQPVNGAMGQGHVPAAQPGYPGQEPAPRPKKRRSIGGIILLVFGAVTIVASIAGCLAIDLIPGDHGDSGDGLAWAGVALLLYVFPFGLMLVVSGLILVFAARSRSR